MAVAGIGIRFYVGLARSTPAAAQRAAFLFLTWCLFSRATKRRFYSKKNNRNIFWNSSKNNPQFQALGRSVGKARKLRDIWILQSFIEDYAETTDKFFSDNGKWRILPSSWDINPVEAYEQKGFMNALYRCLSEMPKRHAEAFVYREIDGLSTEEICKVLSITASNCWVMLYRARVLLRRCIEINWTRTTV